MVANKVSRYGIGGVYLSIIFKALICSAVQSTKSLQAPSSTVEEPGLISYSPSTKYVVSAEIEYAKALILEIIRKEVKIIPPGFSSCTSPNPKVDIVITVM